MKSIEGQCPKCGSDNIECDYSYIVDGMSYCYEYCCQECNQCFDQYYDLKFSQTIIDGEVI